MRSLTFQEPQKTRQSRAGCAVVFARFEERIDDNLEISRKTLVLFTFLPWRSFWALHFGQLPFPSVALFFVALTPLKNKSSWLVWFCHLLVTGWAGGAPSHLKLMEINESDGFFGAVGTISFSLCVYWCSLLTELQGFSGQCRWHRIFVGLPSRFSPGDLGNIFWLGMLSVKASCIAKPIVTKLTI